MNWKPGDIVRYGSGPTALARLVSPHAGGWHAEQFFGGILFIHDAGWGDHLIITPTEEDIEAWRQEHAKPHRVEDRLRADTEDFLNEVRTELIRARTKFPGDRIMTIALAEEFGELCKAVLDEPAASVRKEAVQTAVMAARVVLDGDGSVREWRSAKGLDPIGSNL